jgi:hypothetical protein
MMNDLPSGAIANTEKPALFPLSLTISSRCSVQVSAEMECEKELAIGRVVDRADISKLIIIRCNHALKETTYCRTSGDTSCSLKIDLLNRRMGGDWLTRAVRKPSSHDAEPENLKAARLAGILRVTRWSETLGGALGL